MRRHHTNSAPRFYFNRFVLFLARHFLAWVASVAVIVLLLLVALRAYIDAPTRYHQSPLVLLAPVVLGLMVIPLVRVHAAVMAVRAFLATHIDLNNIVGDE